MDNILPFKKPNRIYDELLKSIFSELRHHLLFKSDSSYVLELKFSKKDYKTFTVKSFKVAEVVTKGDKL